MSNTESVLRPKDLDPSNEKSPQSLSLRRRAQKAYHFYQKHPFISSTMLIFSAGIIAAMAVFPPLAPILLISISAKVLISLLGASVPAFFARSSIQLGKTQKQPVVSKAAVLSDRDLSPNLSPKSESPIAISPITPPPAHPVDQIPFTGDAIDNGRLENTEPKLPLFPHRKNLATASTGAIAPMENLHHGASSEQKSRLDALDLASPTSTTCAQVFFPKQMRGRASSWAETPSPAAITALS